MSDWEVRMSQSRQRPYFYSSSTQQSTWETPDGLTPEQVMKLPGAHYLQGLDSSNTPTQVRASHLLIKHRDSRRPASWKDQNITRSKDEAKQILQGHLDVLKSTPKDQLASKFAELASTESDCSSAKKGGDLGPFTRGQMQKPFEDATWSTQVGELSDIIETDSGVHVIYRTA